MRTSVPAVIHPRAGRWPQPLWRIAVVALLLSGAASWVQLNTPEAVASLEQQAQAVAAMRRLMAHLAATRERLGLPIDPRIDPSRTGLIGVEWSQITTSLGNLEAKRTALHPLWAGVVVELLLATGAGPGDLVVAGLSGSFPGLNLAVFVAADVLGLDLIAMTSLGASNWGANIPEWTWLDMERALFDAGLIGHRSVLLTPGGERDQGPLPYLFPEGLSLLHTAARRHGETLYVPTSLEDAIARRMRLVRTLAGGPIGQRVKAYINVGGGEASLGRCEGILRLAPGWSPPERVPSCGGGGWEVPGVISLMAGEGVPVIHLLNVRELGVRYGIPVDGAFSLE